MAKIKLREDQLGDITAPRFELDEYQDDVGNTIKRTYNIDELKGVDMSDYDPPLKPVMLTETEKYLEYFRVTTKKMYEITKAKNHDYAGGSGDPFSNFTGVEGATSGVVTPEQGFLTRMYDKYARISNFVKQGTLEVKEESVEDTLIDLANYCILMAAYLRSKKG